MIYVVAFLLPPLALLIEGKVLSAVMNLVLIVAALLLSVLTFFIFSWLLLIPSAHAIIAIAQARRRREHRTLMRAARQGEIDRRGGRDGERHG